MRAMFYPREHLALGGSVALELIGNDHARDVREPFEQLTEELLRGPLIPAALDQDVEHVPFLIYRPLGIVALALNRLKQSSGAGEFHPRALTELDMK